MGAFIRYLYAAHGIKHFFVLAPNLTIYDKLIADFTPNTPKYVFKSALWCRHASGHAKAAGAKPWKYLLIPHDQATEDKSITDYFRFEQLAC
jgi:hypothetical protein